ncbi:MAG: hypothetical protein F6K56_27825 [Moorea sp. SIO3G5]|nr:hypothetical protein [Moorena sp. SIO3G5]
MGETTAVAHGAWVCVRNLRPHRCLPRGTAVAHGGDPQDRAASPRPHCLPCSEAASLLGATRGEFNN